MNNKQIKHWTVDNYQKLMKIMEWFLIVKQTEVE